MDECTDQEELIMYGGMTRYSELYRNLKFDQFSHVFDSNVQGYKFYWLEVIIRLTSEKNTVFTFEEVIEQMIASAWYSVTAYHLNLGPKIQGSQANHLEQAVNVLYDCCQRNNELIQSAQAQDIIAKIHEYREGLLSEMNQLTRYVPYRFLSSFIESDAGRIDWYKAQEVKDAIEAANQKAPLPYTIQFGRGSLNNKVIVHPDWAEFFCNERTVLMGWIQHEKVRFLQDRNPGVPGIVYKLEPQNSAGRKYAKVQELWKTVLSMRDIEDIYTQRSLNDEKYDLDHFVPWAYVASDELWNLTPAEHILNIRKSDRLPDWAAFSKPFLDQQYALYDLIRTTDNTRLKEQFNSCRRNNINAPWAVKQLYIPSNTEYQFKSILESNLKSVYDNAVLQGFLADFGREEAIPGSGNRMFVR